LEALEGRALLSTIVWANQFNPNNGFSLLGTSEANARADVTAALFAWETVIQNFNQPGGGNSISVNISVAGAGRGGVTGIAAVNAGYPTAANISLGGGDDGHGAGYFFDPTPYDNGEFEGTLVNDFAGMAQNGSPAAGLTDFYTVVLHELGHAVGLAGSGTFYGSSPYNHETNVPNPPAFFWVFQGPSVTHLMTSNNEGTQDAGVPIHSAWLDGNVTWNGQQVHGVEDLMNAGLGPSERRLIPSYIALLLHDVYGYTVTAPGNLPTMFAVEDSQGNLLVRGGVGNSDDIISLTRDPLFFDTLDVNIHIGTPVPGIAPNPIYTARFYVGGLSSITIDAGAGTNDVYLEYTPPGISTWVTGHGFDTVHIGNNGSAQDINGPVNVSNPSAYTTLEIADWADPTGRTVYVSAAKVNGLAPVDINYLAGEINLLSIQFGTGNNTVYVQGTGTTTDLIGNGGSDTVNVGDQGSLWRIAGTLNIDNPPSYTTVNVDDSTDPFNHTVTVSSFTPPFDTPWGSISGLAPAPINYELEDTTSPITMRVGSGVNTLTVTGGTSFQTLYVQTSGGDTLDVLALAAAVTLDITGTGGANTVILGNNGSVQDIQGTVNLDNPLDYTTLTVDDSADPSAHTAYLSTFTPGGDFDSWGSITGLAPGTINYEYPDTSSVTLDTGAVDGNVVDVFGTGTVTNLVGHGRLTLNVGKSGSVQPILGTVNVEDPGSAATVTVDDSSDSTAHPAATPVVFSRFVNGSDSQGNSDWWGSISSLAPAAINYEFADTASLTVKGGTGNNTYDVEATGANDLLPYFGVATQLNTGLGTDVVNVGNGNTVDEIQGPLTVNGQGPCTLNVNDQASTVAQNYDVWSNLLDVRNILQGLIYYSGIGTIMLNGSSAGSTYNVMSTAALWYYFNGGSGKDVFNIGSPDSLAWAMTVNGNGGGDTMNVADQGSKIAQTYNLWSNVLHTRTFFQGLIYYFGLGTVNLKGSSAGSTYNIETTAAGTAYNVYGGSGTDTFNVSPLFQYLGNIAGPVTLSGGGGTDALTVNDQKNAGNTITAGSDTVGAKDSAPISYAGIPTVTVNGGSGGAFVVPALPAAAVVTLNGGSGTNTLTGPNAATTWALNGLGAGNLGSNLLFTGMQDLVGGSGVDVFAFTAGGSVSGSIDGGAAPLHQGNWLDYSALATAVAVNLQTGSATGVAGGAVGKVSNIQDVHGSNGGSTLTGDAQGNVLIGGTGADTITGGTGASILIGDKGADQISGGSALGGDILIGDYTTFDAMTTANQAALMSILAEWQSADSYANRFHDIHQGTSYLPGSHLNGNNKLVFGPTGTVRSDGAVDTLTAAVSGQALDWFFLGTGDTKHHFESGEHVNNN
jgi:hypothetical protein